MTNKKDCFKSYLSTNYFIRGLLKQPSIFFKIQN
jgi:hypothetical protein